MMSRKDYVKFAELLKKQQGKMPQIDHSYMVMDFQELFLTDNPNFDKVRFWNAVYKGEENG